MTWPVEIAPAADADLVSIENYLAEQASPEIAARQVDRIVALIEKVADNPLVYEERPALGQGYRLAMARPYVVIFRCSWMVMRVLRIVHGARDLPSLLRDPPPQDI